MNGASLAVTNLCIVSASSQLTLSDGANFIVNRTARVSQSAPLKLLPAGGNRPSAFENDGRWTSTSDLEIVVTTRGVGTFEFGTGSKTTVTGINFTTGAMTLTGAQFTVIGSFVTVGSIDGRSSTIDHKGQTFTVLGNANIANYIHENGQTSVGGGNFGTVDVQNGLWNLTGIGATIGTLRFEGGLVSATHGKGAAITVTSTILTGTEPKTFEDIRVTTTSVSLSCGVQQCQLFTKNAIFTTPTFLDK